MSLAIPKAQGKRDDLPESTSLQIKNEVKPKVKALADAGVTKAESHRAEKLAKKSEEAREAHTSGLWAAPVPLRPYALFPQL